MKRVAVDSLKSGMIVARAIFNDDDRILLHSGIVLTNVYIKRLRELGIDYIYIQE